MLESEPGPGAAEDDSRPDKPRLERGRILGAGASFINSTAGRTT